MSGRGVWVTRFLATGEPPSTELPTLDVRGGELAITQDSDGPLLANGPLEVMAGTGRAVNRATRTALCGCGASKNKPYCDGSHTGIGITTD